MTEADAGTDDEVEGDEVEGDEVKDDDSEVRTRPRSNPSPRRRRILIALAVVLGVLVAFLGITGFTGLDGPGMLQRYPYQDLQTLSGRVNDEAGPFRTPDDCWRIPEDHDGPLRSIAAVDYLRSRVVIRAYAAQAGVIDASTFNRIADRVDAIIKADPDLSWAMVEIEPSPDGWSPLVSCALVTRGY